MQEAGELEQMRLLGYVQLTENGFALPVYGAGPGANAWYCAIASVEGDHTSSIAGFELVEDEQIVPLPDSAIVVSPGDPWQDVFLWGGRVFTGTAGQIFDAVAVYRDELRALAPLSYLDLAVAAGSPASANLAADALAFLEGRLGRVSGETAFRELVLRSGVLVELRRQFQKVDQNQLPTRFRDFVVREYEPGQYEVEMVPGTTASVGGDPAAAELRASIGRFGDIIGLPLRATGLSEPEPVAARSESPAHEPAGGHKSGRGTDRVPFPNVLIIATDRRAAQIARYLEPPMEVAFGAGSVWGGEGYRVDRAGEAYEPARPNDALFRICDGWDPNVPLDAFSVVVWLAGNESLRNDKANAVLQAIRSRTSEIPFLIAPTPPANGPSMLLANEQDGDLLLRCNALIDTTLARSPFWTGKPRRSVDRRMADIVATVSVVVALDGELREALKAAPGSRRPRVLSFLGGQSKFSVERATASELNAAGLEVYESRTRRPMRVGFELRDRFSPQIRNAFLELQPLQGDFVRFAEAAVMEALDQGAASSSRPFGSREMPASIRSTLDNPELATAIRMSGSRYDPVIITAETPDLASLREAEIMGAALVRYTDVETVRATFDRDRPRELPSEVRLPALFRYPRNRGLATRGVDARDVVRLPEDLWRAMLSRHTASELAGQERRYVAAIDTRGAVPEIALPVPAVWNAINAGDGLAEELLERVPRLEDKYTLSGKRTGDLITAWSRPAHSAERWVVEDGRVPVELTRLEPGEVPAQRLFFIDGDGAVPIFLLSRPFAIWARALLPSSTSWASRFQVSKTFDAFPFSKTFMVHPSENGNPPHLHLSTDGAARKKLSALARDDAYHLATIANEFGHDEQALRRNPAMRQIDAILLQDIQLPPDASDLDVLEKLIKLNTSRT
jgi:hypothetical protein